MVESVFSSVTQEVQSKDKESPICTGCQVVINENYLMKVNDSYWHDQCLRCCLCSTQLTESCFYDKQQRLYCKTDYQRLFTSTTCCQCNTSISPNDLVFRVYGKMYHIRCFLCVRCGTPLRKGDQYLMHGNGDLTCKACNDEAARDQYFMAGTGDGGARSNKREVKRPRTVLSSAQRRVFKEAFDRSPRPCRKEREKLSSQTGLSVRVVQVWFQNQRAKVKKLARRKANKDKTMSDSDGDDVLSGSRTLYNTHVTSTIDDKMGEAKVTSSVDGYPDILSTTDLQHNYTALRSPKQEYPSQSSFTEAMCRYADMSSIQGETSATRPPNIIQMTDNSIYNTMNHHQNDRNLLVDSYSGQLTSSASYVMDALQKLQNNNCHFYNGTSDGNGL